MKVFIIAAIVLFALVSAAPEDPKLRGLESVEPPRNLGLLDLDLNLNVLDLVKVILVVDINDRTSINDCLYRIRLLRLKLVLQLGLLGGCPPSLVHLDAKLGIADLLKIIANVNLGSASSCCHALEACDLLTKCLNALPAHRNLGGLLDLNLNLDILDLIKVCLGVDIHNAESVKNCLYTIGVLKIKLDLHITLLGGCPANLVHVDAKLGIADLLKIIAEVDLGNAASCCRAREACDLLTICLNAIIKRNLGAVGGAGDLVNANLKAEILCLIEACVKLNIGDITSVKATIDILNLLCADLELCLPVSISIGGTIIDIDVNATILDLIHIIAKVDIGNPTSVLTCIKACQILVVKLKAIVAAH